MKLDEQRILEAEAIRLHDEVDSCQCLRKGAHYGEYLAHQVFPDAEEVLERYRNPEPYDAATSILKRLVEARKAQGLTQKDMATSMHVTQSSVSLFENGKNDPRLSTLMRYAKVLNMKLYVKGEL